MQRMIVIAGLAACLAACASDKAWHKDGASQQDLVTDQYGCDKDVHQSNNFRSGESRDDFFANCMNAHGWYLR